MIKFSELQTIPWKNGGGVTREIAALREHDKIIWRLSIADVSEDGPFSAFPGLTRILTVIDGSGIVLTSSDHAVDALFGAPVMFDGGEACESKLIDGPIRDFNVMFEPKLCNAEVILIQAPADLVLPVGSKQTIAILGLAGETLVEQKYQLLFGDTVLVDTGSIALDLTGNASALVVKISLLD
jgi:uncharacterized protein